MIEDLMIQMINENFSKIESSDSQSGGLINIQYGGGDNNFRYFLNRLKEYDLELIEPEGRIQKYRWKNESKKYLC